MRTLTRRETEDLDDLSEFAIEELDLDDAAQLPYLMGWAGGVGYMERRARYMEEIAEELGAFRHKIRGRRT